LLELVFRCVLEVLYCLEAWMEVGVTTYRDNGSSVSLSAILPVSCLALVCRELCNLVFDLPRVTVVDLGTTRKIVQGEERKWRVLLPRTSSIRGVLVP
jgi:hypothetical protein